MITKTQVKITLLGAAAGYLVSEYVVQKLIARDIRRQEQERRIHLAQVLWAKWMVDREAARGRYNNRVIPDAVKADFDYYLTIAPDPREHRRG